MLKKAFLLLTLVLSLISCKNKEAEPNEISQEERETIVWSDEDLESNNNYFYMVSIEKDGIEYPGSDTLEVMVM